MQNRHANDTQGDPWFQMTRFQRLTIGLYNRTYVLQLVGQPLNPMTRKWHALTRTIGLFSDNFAGSGPVSGQQARDYFGAGE